MTVNLVPLRQVSTAQWMATFRAPEHPDADPLSPGKSRTHDLFRDITGKRFQSTFAHKAE
jgi:hypothetical protein